MAEATTELPITEIPAAETAAADSNSSEPLAAKVNPKRLYINNVSYQTTEDDLQELLKEFKIASILIPSQTVRGIKSVKQKSLGIAYVDFETVEDAERAKSVIDGYNLKDRALRVKNFVPYSPNNIIKRYNSKRSANKAAKASTDGVANSTPMENLEEEGKENLTAGEPSEARESTSAEVANQDTAESSKVLFPASEPLSNDTVFVSRLSAKTTDGDLREYFHEYGPTDVYIFKNRYKKGSRFHFHHNQICALVTLSVEDGVARALVELKEKTLKNKSVLLRSAYISKIEEVKKAAQKMLAVGKTPETSTGSTSIKDDTDQTAAAVDPLCEDVKATSLKSNSGEKEYQGSEEEQSKTECC